MVLKAFSGWGRTNFSLEITIWLIWNTSGTRQVGNHCRKPNLYPTSIERSVCVCCNLPGSWGGRQAHWGACASRLLGNPKPCCYPQLSWAAKQLCLEACSGQRSAGASLMQPHTGQQQTGWCKATLRHSYSRSRLLASPEVLSPRPRISHTHRCKNPHLLQMCSRTMSLRNLPAEFHSADIMRMAKVEEFGYLLSIRLPTACFVCTLLPLGGLQTIL